MILSLEPLRIYRKTVPCGAGATKLSCSAATTRRKMKNEIIDIVAPVSYEQDDMSFAGAAEYCASGSNMCE